MLGDFARLAEEYCRLIEGREQGTGEQLLTRVHGLLPRLYCAALALPEVGWEGPDTDEEDEYEEEPDDEPFSPADLEARLAEGRKDRIPQDQWWVIFRSLGQMFGDKDAYFEVFDPYAEDPQEELVTGTLADDLTDIYRDLSDGLTKWRRGEHEDAAYEWRANFMIHWGEHATGALRAIHALAWDGQLRFPVLDR